MTPDRLERALRRRMPHLSPTVRLVLVLAVVAVALYGVSRQQATALRSASDRADDQQRLAAQSSCRRGNVVRAVTMVRDPPVGRMLLLLDCRGTIRSKDGPVPLGRAEAAALLERVRACIAASDPAIRPAPACVRLMNGADETPVAGL